MLRMNSETCCAEQDGLKAGDAASAGCGLETNGQSAASEEAGGAGGVAPFSETA